MSLERTSAEVEMHVRRAAAEAERRRWPDSYRH